MKKIILTIAAVGLTGLSASAVLAATDFATLDSDGNESLSISDIQVGYPDFTQDQFIQLDIDGNGTLDFNEFAGVASLGLDGSVVEGGVAAEGNAMAAVTLPAFDDIDQNDDDKLDLNETLQVYPTLSQIQFDTADLDGDTFLNNTEFGGLEGVAMEPVVTGSVTGAVSASSTMTFMDLDQDDDDKLTLAEALQAWPDLSQSDFDAADLDKDTFLNNTEYEALANS